MGALTTHWAVVSDFGDSFHIYQACELVNQLMYTSKYTSKSERRSVFNHTWSLLPTVKAQYQQRWTDSFLILILIHFLFLFLFHVWIMNYLPVESRLGRNETRWDPCGPVSVKYRDGHFGGSPKTVLAELMVSLCPIFGGKEMALKMCHLSGFYSASIQDQTQCCFEKFVFFVYG